MVLGLAAALMGACSPSRGLWQRYRPRIVAVSRSLCPVARAEAPGAATSAVQVLRSVFLSLDASGELIEPCGLMRAEDAKAPVAQPD